MLQTLMGGLAVLLGVRRPIKVAHYITYRCNLACEMCGRRAIDSSGELDTRACKDLQTAFRGAGTLVWSFSGGEALLRKDIGELSRHAKDIGYRLILVTNGLLLPERLDAATAADVVNVSIDGNRDSHDRLRGAGMYDKTIAGLDAFVPRRPRHTKLILQAILNNETIQQLDHMVELARQYHAQVGFNPAIVHRSDVRKENAQRFYPSPEEYQTFCRWLAEKKQSPDGRYVFDSPAFFDAIGNYPYDPTRISCHGGRHQCSIDPLGRVLPCSDFFDFEENYTRAGVEFKYGLEGWRELKPVEACPYAFCCTAKKNYFFSHPWQIVQKFVRRGS